MKNPAPSAGDAGDMGLIPGPGRSPGVENGNPLQYSCLENSMDRGVWRATVHGLAKSEVHLSIEHTPTHSFTQKIFIEGLLCAKHSSRH